MKNSTDISETSPAFKTLFIKLLKGIYNTEHAIVDALPTLIQAATTQELKESFQDHELVTKRQIMRLERIFRKLDLTVEKQSCAVMETFEAITQKIIKVTPDNSMVRDAGLIVVAQQIEHYEIATYGGLIQFALAIEAYEIANLLEQTLEEEEDTDFELTQIGECHINLQASEEESHTQENEEKEEEKNSSSSTKRNSASATKDKETKLKK
ncbi:ferritin-like domain-containing protein [Myroides sp. DW712]|uniref:YciE/YciF ferroxidase family protein n=1 Tax=Myroides sp. DW712 TaxID=3389800 RepID=UPI00397BDBF3